MRNLITVFILASVLVSSAQATTIKGPGGESCSTWIKERKEDGEATRYTQLWVLGYVSGLNTSGALKKDIMKKVDANSLFDWIDTYCKRNPLDRIVEASNNLVNELHK